MRNDRRLPHSAASNVPDRSVRCARTAVVSSLMIALLGVTILTAATASPPGARDAAGAGRAAGETAAVGAEQGRQ